MLRWYELWACSISVLRVYDSANVYMWSYVYACSRGCVTSNVVESRWYAYVLVWSEQVWDVYQIMELNLVTQTESSEWLIKLPSCVCMCSSVYNYRECVYVCVWIRIWYVWIVVCLNLEISRMFAFCELPRANWVCMSSLCSNMCWCVCSIVCV